MVEGRLQTRDWETKDGQKRSVVEVVAERVQFMGRSKSAAAAAPGGVPEPVEAGGEADDEVPF
jgi:single-strand DNA-binding protein